MRPDARLRRARRKRSADAQARGAAGLFTEIALHGQGFGDRVQYALLVR